MQLFVRRFLSAVAFLLLSSLGGSALADDKRPEQDYGRPQESTTAGDVLAWPVRVVLFPLFLINEFIFRRPIGWLVIKTEKYRVVETVQDFFTFGPRNEVTIYPSALLDFGLLPSVGFNMTWKHFISEDNTFRAHFGTWGWSWLNAKVTTTYDFSKKEHLSLTAAFVRRRDNPFFGIGPHSSQDAETRFGAQTFDFAPTYERDLWRSSELTATAGVRGLDFFHGTCCSDPSLDFALVDNQLPVPSGYQRGYYGGYQRMSAALDTRRPKPIEGGGFRIEAHEETMFDVSNHPGEARRSWIKWGGAMGGAVDLTGHQRVLSLGVRAEFADPIQGQVPFTDQATLGGDEIMPGFIRNRMIDRSSLAARLQYVWPVWMYLDGVLTASMGNVWGEHLNNFKVQDSRLTAGIGVRSNGDRDSGFELLAGAGTDPLSEGFSVSSFRLLIGSHHGL